MNEFLKKSWIKLKQLLDKYPALFAAAAIYLYYLFSSVELFKEKEMSRGFVDYLLFFLYSSLAVFKKKYLGEWKKHQDQRWITRIRHWVISRSFAE